MFAAFDWNEVMTKALMGGVLGGVGGAIVGLIAYLTRKSEAQQQAEFEARERARIYTQMHRKANKPEQPSSLLLLLMVVVVAVVCVLVANPPLVTRLFRGGGGATAPSVTSRPGATILDYGRYRGQSPVRVAPGRSVAGDAGAAREKELVLLEQTDQVFCRVGETWGIRIRCSDLPVNRPYTVRQETYHPPIRRPDGWMRSMSADEWKIPSGEAPGSFYGWHYLKGHENELVAGEWSVVVSIDDVEVARKVFSVRK